MDLLYITFNGCLLHYISLHFAYLSVFNDLMLFDMWNSFNLLDMYVRPSRVKMITFNIVQDCWFGVGEYVFD